MKRALFCYDGPLYKDVEGHYHDSILNDQMFERYFAVADELSVAIRIRSLESSGLPEDIDQIRDSHIQVIEIPNLSSVGGLLRDSINAQTVLKKAIAEADLIFVRLPSMIGNFAVDLARKSGKPYLIEVVGCPWDSYRNYNFRGRLFAPVAKTLMTRHVECAPFVVYVTSEFLQKRYPTSGKSIACSNVELASTSEAILGARLRRIQNLNGNSTLIIGTAAGIDVRYKGQQYVIKALGKLKAEGMTNLTYQLAGGGTGTYLMQLAKEYGVESSVEFIGQLPHEQVFGWLDSIDIYIQPSRQEGLPRSVIEAMSRGVPCLGASTAGIPELLQPDCIFSNTAAEVSEIADLLKRASCSSDILSRWAKRNFLEAKKYERSRLTARRSNFFKEFASYSVGIK